MATKIIYDFTNNAPSKSVTRFNWLDWMKAIGIWLIVYGHFFSIGNHYVYVFSVPLFFLISGFLCKQETDNKFFWKKIWFNLVIPLLIICTINYLLNSLIRFIFYSSLPSNPLVFIGEMLAGVHYALGAFWFVYTLIILKIILHFTKKAYIHIILLVLFCVLAYFINNNTDIEVLGKHPFRIAWAIPDTFVAYPFFIVGYYLRNWKKEISEYEANKYTPLWFILTILIVFVCGHNHSHVFLYICDYGDNIFLFLIGGFAGSFLVFLISKLLDKYQWRFITDISNGTILILGFHGFFITLFRHFFTKSIVDVIFSLIIVLVFVPIIRFCKSKFPIIMGKYRIQNI